MYQSAAKQVLDGTISEKGILAPMNSRINGPLMKELKEKYGYVFSFRSLSTLHTNTALSESPARRRSSTRINRTVEKISLYGLKSVMYRDKSST